MVIPMNGFESKQVMFNTLHFYNKREVKESALPSKLQDVTGTWQLQGTINSIDDVTLALESFEC